MVIKLSEAKRPKVRHFGIASNTTIPSSIIGTNPDTHHAKALNNGDCPN